MIYEKKTDNYINICNSLNFINYRNDVDVV